MKSIYRMIFGSTAVPRATTTAAALCIAFLASSAHAQTAVSTPFAYSVTTNYSYRADGIYAGLLSTTTTSAADAALCSLTTESYDPHGNHSGRQVTNCTTPVPPASAIFPSRNDSSSAPAVASQIITVNGVATPVSYPEGLFSTSVTNSLNQTDSRQFDPRFGTTLQVTGPNLLTTKFQFDDFARPIREVHADGTSRIALHCLLPLAGVDTSSNSTGCPTPAVGEAPADAVRFDHVESHDANDVKMSAFQRTYFDRLGRTIRVATEGFDGANQPAARSGALVVRDIVYGIYGTKLIETRPYFLASGSTSSTASADVGARLVDYDALGRPVAAYTTDPEGRAGTKVIGSSSGVAYGQYGSHIVAKTSVQYSGSRTVYTNDAGQQRVMESDPLGQVLRVTDAAGGQLSHLFDAFGHLVQTRDALGNAIKMTYDVGGNKLQIVDPDRGTVNFTYDPLGELLTQQTPNELAWNSQTSMTYDALGRMVSRSAHESSSTWTYDSCANGKGKLCLAQNSTNYTHSYGYDAMGRLVQKRAYNNVVSLPSAASYDSVTGKLATVTYPTGLTVGYAYTARGFVEQLQLKTAATINPLPATPGGTPGPSATLAAGATLWRANSVNASGGMEQQAYGNGVIGRQVFEAGTGRLTDVFAGENGAADVLSQHFGWDSLSNMLERDDANGDGNTGAVTESFTYADGLNRLTSYKVSAPAIPNMSRTVNLQYNAIGMLLYKSDVGNYTYGSSGANAVRPHALLSSYGAVISSYGYDANGNVTSSSNGKYNSITYNSFDLPDSTGIAGRPGQPSYSFLYDENHARVRQVRTKASANGSGSDVRTIWYDHPDNEGDLSFEYEIDAPAVVTAATPQVNENRHYLSAAGAIVGVLVSEGTLDVNATVPPSIQSITLRKVEYWHQDHLGSLISTTDHAGNVTQRYAYDPFGKRRFTNGSYDANGNLVIDWSDSTSGGTGRGFTGHEEMDDVGLVNMNGRIFDPTLGLFLQPDPHVVDPWDMQSYNRYGYCWNNPMTCTDPSGFDAEDGSPGPSDPSAPGPYDVTIDDDGSPYTMHVDPLNHTITDSVGTMPYWGTTLTSLGGNQYQVSLNPAGVDVTYTVGAGGVGASGGGYGGGGGGAPQPSAIDIDIAQDTQNMEQQLQQQAQQAQAALDALAAQSLAQQQQALLNAAAAYVAAKARAAQAPPPIVLAAAPRVVASSVVQLAASAAPRQAPGFSGTVTAQHFVSSREHFGAIPNIEAYVKTPHDAFKHGNEIQCVYLVQSLSDSGRTQDGHGHGRWFAGTHMAPDTVGSIPVGTPVASGWDSEGAYPNGRHQHAAVFLRADATGFWVVEQYAGKPSIMERHLDWVTNRTDYFHDANQYYTIRW